MANQNKTIVKYCITIFAFLAVLYPLTIAALNTTWSLDSTLLLNLFPLFGILAFMLLWLHSVSGVFERRLRQYVDFDQFVSSTASLILIGIILHPLLLLINVSFNFTRFFLFSNPVYIRLAVIGWILLLIYDVTKPLKKKYAFFVRNWNEILLISNIGFLITFFHSLGAGGDLQSGPLRTIWIFYGVTAILAIIYTYAIDTSWQE